MTNPHDHARALAAAHWDRGAFLDELRRLVAIPSESQNPAAGGELRRYLEDGLVPFLQEPRFEVRILDNPEVGGGPFLVATRIERADLPTVLVYGHGDVVNGNADAWRDGLDPWTVSVEGDRIYGRGTADNKGQHLVALKALAVAAAARGGSLGFNAKIIIETGEERGSVGLAQFIERHRDLLAADVFIGVDGPRQSFSRPEIRLGNRGVVVFDLAVDLRDGSHHSGHWGGVLADPGVLLAHALAAIVSADGRILVPEWLPPSIPQAVREACRTMVADPIPGMPEGDANWGEPGMNRLERTHIWSSVTVQTLLAGNPARPMNAVPPSARARVEIRHTVDADPADFLPALRRRLDGLGLTRVAIVPVADEVPFPAHRTDPGDSWVGRVVALLEADAKGPVNVVPCSSGSDPGGLFAQALGLPVIWMPHSYAGCRQHGPDEHALGSLLRRGLLDMTGLFCRLGDR